ncbi:hypothetical protein [Bdellovibrio sp. HCB337]|uniref:vWA domain-containing protein n=1 Tax=Bdellovibrio sp. HCB337 TaxID=3394358 RepID=UPI0039A65407
MEKSKSAFLILPLLTTLISACSPESASLVTRPPQTRLFEKSFEVSPSEATFKQTRYDQNEVSLQFQVLKNGASVNNLKATDLKVYENGIPVNPFELSAQTERINQVADIVFLVDITGTMVELIESAKKRLAEFVKSSRKAGYHTRMCIATFGDYTVKKCSRFFDNNPNDRSTESQVKELLSELAQLHAYRGNGKDPGWPDLDENPMGALVDVSKAPWGENSQRFVILVTDWGFLYSPDNQGTIGDKAPTMKQVTDAIKAAQMKVFAVTRTKHTHKGKELVWDGFNTPFQGEQGIVQTSDGEHFDFDKVLKGEITLNQILQRILDRLDTTYKLSYIVDQISGLNPTLPLDKRDVKLSLAQQDGGEFVNKTITSSMPKGRPEYQTSWKVADGVLSENSVRVYVDNKELPASEYSVSGQNVVLKTPPKAGASIRFVYYQKDVTKHLRLEPMSFADGMSSSNVKVYLNGVPARSGDVIFTKDTEGNTSVSFSEAISKPSAPYKILENKGLKVKIEVTGVL